MPIFRLTLQKTYYNQGFFNVTAEFDRYVRKAEGPIKLQFARSGQIIEGRLDRHANRNGTPRILGGVRLRDWFQKNFEPMDIVDVDLGSTEVVVLLKPGMT